MSALSHVQQVLFAAERWIEHARSCGARFNVKAKADKSVRFSLSHEFKAMMGKTTGAFTLAIPSCLRGVSEHQVVIRRLAEGYYEGRRLFPRLVDGRIALFVQGIPQIGEVEGERLIGFLKDKHVQWALPLLDELRFYVKNITGLEHTNAGVNVVITDINLALNASRTAPIAA